MGFVGREDHQGVLQHALFLQAAEERIDRVIQVGNGRFARSGELGQVFRSGRVGLVGAHGQQGEHPRLLRLAQFADVVQRAFEERLVVHAPGEFQVRRVLEPVAAQGLVEAHRRHDLVLGHETQPGTLQEVGAEAVLVQLRRQALRRAGGVAEQFQALRRAIVELAVVAAKQGIHATDGLVAVHHVVRGGHGALRPGAELGHQRFVVAAAERCPVGGHVGARDTFHRHDQHVARLAVAGQQRGAAQVEAGQAAGVHRDFRLVAILPVLDGQFGAGERTGEQLVRQVELLPFPGVAGHVVLHAEVAEQHRYRHGVGVARQRLFIAPPEHAAEQHAGAQRCQQPRVAQAAARRRVADELRVQQVFDVGYIGHAPDGADQFHAADADQAPQQHHRQGDDQPTVVQQQNQQAADEQVRQVAEGRAPAQQMTADQRNQQEKGGEGGEIAASLPPASK
ncbi:hypothetical protein D9M71_190070 [compost metagenome]